MKKLLLAVFLVLAGCSALTQKPPLSNQIEAASKLTQDVASQIGHLQKTAQITQEQEAKYLDRLDNIHDQIKLAASLAKSCKPDCSNAETQLKVINDQLIKLQTEANQ